MKRNALVVAAAAVILGGVAAVLGVAGAQAETPADVIEVLSRPVAAADALPGELPAPDFGDGGLVTDTSRFLGSDGPRDFWVAEDAGGNVCVIVALNDPGRTIAAACNRPDRVAEHGQNLGAQGSDGVTYVVYLLPDGADTDGVGDGWTVVASNLVVAPADDDAGVTRVPVGSGSIELSRS